MTLTRSWRRGGILWRGFGQRVNTLRTGQGIDSHSSLTRFLGLPSTLAYRRQPDSGFTQYGGGLHGQWKESGSADWILHYDRDQQDSAKRSDQLLGGDGSRRAEVANIMSDFAYLRHNRSKFAGFDLVSGSVSYAAQREERINQRNTVGQVQRQYERTRTWGHRARLRNECGSRICTLAARCTSTSFAAPPRILFRGSPMDPPSSNTAFTRRIVSCFGNSDCA